MPQTGASDAPTSSRTTTRSNGIGGVEADLRLLPPFFDELPQSRLRGAPVGGVDAGGVDAAAAAWAWDCKRISRRALVPRLGVSNSAKSFFASRFATAPS